MKIAKSIIRASFLFVAMVLVNFSATAQCDSFDKYPGGEEEGKKAHVLYRDFMKQENFKDAFPGWEKVFSAAPGGSEWHYMDGVKLYVNLYENTEDTDEQAKYIAKLNEIYANYLTCFGKTDK